MLHDSEIGRQAEREQKEEPGNRCHSTPRYILPNILLHHYPGVMVPLLLRPLLGTAANSPQQQPYKDFPNPRG
jgi:hypothetical protein